jgi:IclR family acetate operon transcriptional repressor
VTSPSPGEPRTKQQLKATLGSRADREATSSSAGKGEGSDNLRPTGTQAIERAVAVLCCFERSAELSATEIAHETSLNFATASRIARALRDAGLLAQDQGTDRYQLGVGTALLGRLALERLGVGSAYPQLEGLARATGESVNLGVRDGAQSLTLMHFPSANALRVEQYPGTRNPLYACSMGKVLLAFGGEPPPYGWSYERFTERTITSDEQLAAALDEVRAIGYAVNDQEKNIGVRAVSAPVFDRRGAARAAVAVQGPAARITDDRITELAQAAVAVAERLSQTGLPIP